jgi:hypothetical protein
VLTQNSELRKDGIWNWTLPAWVVRDSTGKAHNVCPQAGACVRFCYARNGTYNFPNVRAAHVRNLERVTGDLNGWLMDMMAELGRGRYLPKGKPRLPDLPRDHLHPHVAQMLDAGCAAVRIHDSGDFFSEDYLLAWLAIAANTPHVLFYAYTKEVGLFKRVVEPSVTVPPNFLWVYSMGGKQDWMVDKAVDRHADVFPDEDAIVAAGYTSQEANDLLCVLSPSHRVGIPANNIPHYRKRMGYRTFSQVESEIARHGRGAALDPVVPLLPIERAG